MKKLIAGSVAILVVPAVLYGIGYGVLMLLPRHPEASIAVRTGSFAFAVLGDAPYSPVEFELFDVVLEDLAAHDLTSVIHVGDIFSEPCLDEAYRRVRDEFNSIPHPVVYTPGDNEWTDCFNGSEESNPYNRLASIR